MAEIDLFPGGFINNDRLRGDGTVDGFHCETYFHWWLGTALHGTGADVYIEISFDDGATDGVTRIPALDFLKLAEQVRRSQ